MLLNLKVSFEDDKGNTIIWQGGTAYKIKTFSKEEEIILINLPHNAIEKLKQVVYNIGNQLLNPDLVVPDNFTESISTIDDDDDDEDGA
jgi:hypothetical protein